MTIDCLSLPHRIALNGVGYFRWELFTGVGDWVVATLAYSYCVLF